MPPYVDYGDDVIITHGTGNESQVLDSDEDTRLPSPRMMFEVMQSHSPDAS